MLFFRGFLIFDRGSFVCTVDTTVLRMCRVWSGPSSVRDSHDKLLVLADLTRPTVTPELSLPGRPCTVLLRFGNEASEKLIFLFGVDLSVESKKY